MDVWCADSIRQVRPIPGADVRGVSPVPGADVRGVSPVPSADVAQGRRACAAGAPDRCPTAPSCNCYAAFELRPVRTTASAASSSYPRGLTWCVGVADGARGRARRRAPFRLPRGVRPRAREPRSRNTWRPVPAPCASAARGATACAGALGSARGRDGWRIWASKYAQSRCRCGRVEHQPYVRAGAAELVRRRGARLRCSARGGCAGGQHAESSCCGRGVPTTVGEDSDPLACSRPRAASTPADQRRPEDRRLDANGCRSVGLGGCELSADRRQGRWRVGRRLRRHRRRVLGRNGRVVMIATDVLIVVPIFG